MNLALMKEKVLVQLTQSEKDYGEMLFNNLDCQLLSQSAMSIDFLVNIADEHESAEYSLHIKDAQDGMFEMIPKLNNKAKQWDRYSYACLLQYEQELSILDPKEKIEHRKYTRQGMRNRVLSERRQKADKASYRIQWADNIYGDHILTNEHGTQYKIFLRDFEKETGYSDSWDSRLNKLGTTKHIMFAFSELKKNQKLRNRLDKTYPFIEVFCDPLNENKITWHYPHELPASEQRIISRFFKKRNYVENEVPEIKSFLQFIEAVEALETICIRPEVVEKVERAFEQSMLKELKQTHKPDYAQIEAELFPYQKEGVEFVLFKKAAIIADEMGLGKTIQAISAAVLKKHIFGFNKTLVVCPATLKSQWKKEIEKFTNEKAMIISGTPKERAAQYRDDAHFFFIANYETIRRDSQEINAAEIDFLILDEAQKIKNFETKTFSSIKRLKAKHTLIITGTPIENRLIDIYSIFSVLDPYFFGPLWEFSCKHCLFDAEKINKINGYYNLQILNEQLSDILIRREKRNVLEQLPNVQQIDIPVELAPAQADYHSSYSAGIAAIIKKKFFTAYDMQKLQLLLAKMRMVCDSTYLVDEKTNVSPKMEVLRDILFEQLDLTKTKRKVIIFSEWIKVHKLIGQMLREHKVGFVELSGKIPVKSRGELIKKFESSAQCNVFLSTEAGGAGLNLQMADILINFELPWNPAKKNQRIGRIDRLGQKSNNLTIYNLITRNSIEMQISAGLLAKQNLFEGVLDNDSKMDYVDFSSKGRSQFIEQLDALVSLEKVKPEGEAETDVADIFRESYEEIIEHEEEFVEQLELADFKGAGATDAQDDVKKASQESKTDEFEQVMTSGMQFLAGLYKMSTGKDMGLDSQQIKINKETGEVTMTFKLPV